MSLAPISVNLDNTDNVRKINRDMLKSPKGCQIRTTRTALGYTQKEAAGLLHVSLRAWQLWEASDRKMPPGLWELFVIKVGLHPLYKAHPSETDSNQTLKEM